MYITNYQIDKCTISADIMGGCNVTLDITAREQVDVNALQNNIFMLLGLPIEDIKKALDIMKLLQQYDVTPEEFTDYLNALHVASILE